MGDYYCFERKLTDMSQPSAGTVIKFLGAHKTGHRVRPLRLAIMHLKLTLRRRVGDPTPKQTMHLERMSGEGSQSSAVPESLAFDKKMMINNSCGLSVWRSILGPTTCVNLQVLQEACIRPHH